MDGVRSGRGPWGLLPAVGGRGAFPPPAPPGRPARVRPWPWPRPVCLRWPGALGPPPLSTPCGTFARRSFWAGSGPDRHRWGGGLVVRAGGRTSSGLHLARRSRVSGQRHEATLEGHTFLGHPSPVRQNWEAKPDGHTGNPQTPSGHPTAHEIDGINKESPLCFTSVSILSTLSDR